MTTSKQKERLIMLFRKSVMFTSWKVAKKVIGVYLKRLKKHKNLKSKYDIDLFNIIFTLGPVLLGGGRALLGRGGFCY